MNLYNIKKSVMRARLFLRIMLITCLWFLLPAQVQAYNENNVQCDRSAGADGVQQLGNVSPGQDISFYIVLDCTVRRRYPVGMNLSYVSAYASSPSGPNFEVGSNGRQVSQGGMGTTGSTCLPTTCTTLAVGYRFSTVIVFKGVAGTSPGVYTFRYSLFATSIGGYENYSDNITAGVIFYTVENPACALVSPSTSNLYFGTLSSDDLSAASQTANIDISCKSSSRASVKLTPTQNVVNSTAGISATTLTGLSMASSWADTGSAVNLGSTRSFNFIAGRNTVSVRFQPRLNSHSVQPVGSFSSQYTLTIDYL